MQDTRANTHAIAFHAAETATADLGGFRRRSTLLAIAAYWPFWGLVLLHAVIVQAWLHLRGGVGVSGTELVGGLLAFLPILMLMFVIWRMVSYAMHHMPASPLRALWQDFLDFFGNPARAVSLLALLPAIYLFFIFFSQFKGNIALLNPFSWDEQFMRLDSWLHGGAQPWEWLFPLLSAAPVTLSINVAYHAWFFAMFGSILWAVSQRRPRLLALRYLVAFLLAWGIGGGLLAYLFSSAGPVYYGRLGLGSDPFTPLMEHLRAVAQHVPLWALDVQETLWAGYQAGNMSLGGISAFPSMHNAQAALMALLAWQLGRRAGWAMTVFALLIALGSVWLGWHYAVDAYAGIAIAFICWWLALPIARWMMNRPAMRRLAALQEAVDSGRL